MRSARLYFEDIFRACDLIVEFIGDQAWEMFRDDEKTKAAVIREFEIIGEACRQMPVDVRNLHPEIPWAKAIGMRNILAHGYFGVDERAVWDAFRQDIGLLRTIVQNVLEDWAE